MIPEVLEKWKQDLIQNRHMATKIHLIKPGFGEIPTCFCALGRLSVISGMTEKELRDAENRYTLLKVKAGISDDAITAVYTANDDAFTYKDPGQAYDAVVKLIDTHPKLFLENNDVKG